MDKKRISYFLELLVSASLIFKILFILFLISYNISLKYDPRYSQLFHNLKGKMDFIYIMIMSIFLVFIFYPWRNNTVFLTKKINNVLFLYGLISIVILLCI
jgi:hypothetical protein